MGDEEWDQVYDLPAVSATQSLQAGEVFGCRITFLTLSPTLSRRLTPTLHWLRLNELLKRFSEIDVAQEKQEIEQNVQPYPVGLRPTGPVNLNVRS